MDKKFGDIFLTHSVQVKHCSIFTPFGRKHTTWRLFERLFKILSLANSAGNLQYTRPQTRHDANTTSWNISFEKLHTLETKPGARIED